MINNILRGVSKNCTIASPQEPNSAILDAAEIVVYLMLRTVGEVES